MIPLMLMRAMQMVLVVLVASMMTFGMSRAAGDPRNLYLTEETTREQYEAWGRAMGLHRPLPVQYMIWLSKVLQGDFGESLRDKRPVTRVIAERLPATLQLSAASFFLAVVIGIPLGVLSAAKRGSVWDYMGRIVALFGQALPAFWIGLMLIWVFSVWLGWLPTGRRGGLDHYILPSITLGWGALAGFLRLTRSSMLESLDTEYVKLARAKGVGGTKVIWKHAFKNALIAPMTFAGLILAAFISGTVVTEVVFAWPGVGRLAVQAILNNDFPLIAGVVMMITVMYVIVNFLVDIAYVFIDPRIRY